MADRVDVPATEGTVTFAGGQAEAKYPEKGTVVDRPAAADRRRGAFLTRRATRRPADEEADPPSRKDAVSRAMDGSPTRRCPAPWSSCSPARASGCEPEDFAPALSMKPVGSELQPQLDGPVLLAALTPKMKTIAKQPQDASFRIVDGKPQVVPAKDGVTFAPDDVTGRSSAC